MPQVIAHHLYLSGVDAPLFDDVYFSIDAGQRIALLGRNGVGKSTLLSLIQGTLQPEKGDVIREKGIGIRTLIQQVPTTEGVTVLDVASQGNEHIPTHEIERWLSKLGLMSDVMFADLSGGMKRKVLLAQALASDPEVLLLDEPTNHLDIESVRWLEQCLLSLKKTVLFVSHDRAFVKKMANTVWELERGKLTVFDGDYARYLVHKEEMLAALALAFAREDKKLAQEEVWIRQGIQARRTRNEGRVRALKQLRRERSERRERTGNVDMTLSAGPTSGEIIVKAENLSFAYPDQVIVRDFSTMLLRGDKIGILGPNGVGKTTLIQLLLGNLKPDTGHVTLGTQLRIAYFDQLRAALDPEMTVVDAVSQGNEFIEVQGNRKHIMGYLQDFLFSPLRARAKIRTLSGGERNRVLLAALFTRPANVLILDEPTNDLDIETLELLESLLVDYTGTLIVVSHDREFLNEVVTSTLAYEGDGRWQEYVGGYDDYVRQVKQAVKEPSAHATKDTHKKTEGKPANTGKKLSFNEKKELESLPNRIHATEAEVARLQGLMVAPDFYKQPAEKIAEVTAKIAALEAQCQADYARWDYLENL